MHCIVAARSAGLAAPMQGRASPVRPTRRALVRRGRSRDLRERVDSESVERPQCEDPQAVDATFPRDVTTALDVAAELFVDEEVDAQSEASDECVFLDMVGVVEFRLKFVATDPAQCIGRQPVST